MAGLSSNAPLMANFVADHASIAMAVSLHTYGGFILRPPCIEPDSFMPGLDFRLLKTLGTRGEETAGCHLLSMFGEFTNDPVDHRLSQGCR